VGQIPYIISQAISFTHQTKEQFPTLLQSIGYLIVSMEMISIFRFSVPQSDVDFTVGKTKTP
jgi:hypothetical protein